MGAAIAAESSGASRRLQVSALLLSIFVVAICGLTYELLIGAVSAYLVGNSVLWFSLVIGGFMTAMGAGAWLSRYFGSDHLVLRFAQIEIAVGLVGGLAGPLLFAAYTWTSTYTPVMFGFVGVIGALVGLEIPLLTRYLESYGSLRRAISDVMAVDYVGALVASVAFPLVLLPTLGLLKTFMAVGLLNQAVGGLTLLVFRRRVSATLWVPLGVAVAVLAGLLGVSERIMSRYEKKLYRDDVVWAESSAYQRVVLTKYRDDTRLYLDGHLQLSSRDEYRYHESLVHPAMGLARAHERVLVLGAGDGMAVREVLRFDGVQQVVLVDLDPAVTRLARSHPALVEANGGSLDDPRVTVVHRDAFSWLEASSDTFDVILMDFPDPHGPELAKLYSAAFYAMVGRHLARGGVAATQASSPFWGRRAYWCAVKTVRDSGLYAVPYHAWVPSFGDWGFVLMSHHSVRLEDLRAHPGARYVRGAVLDTMGEFPEDMGPLPVEVNRLDDPVIVRYYEQGWAQWF